MKVMKKRDRKQRSKDIGTLEQRQTVQSILKDVKEHGDQAVINYSEKFDKVQLKDLFVSRQEVDEAYQSINQSDLDIIKEAINNISSFHEKQKIQSWFSYEEAGTMLGQKVTPIDSVGVYVPGGTAAYPSSVLMNVVPALVAEVNRIVLVSPPTKGGALHPLVLVAADLLRVKEIYKVGGAQAIAALAYGTESIPPVDKIVGPGNIFVALAKKEVFGTVAIDMIAGPSEIVVLADETADAREVAADLLSQAEHDELAKPILVTTSELLAETVQSELEKQLSVLPREIIARRSIEDHGEIYVVDQLEEAIGIVNDIAPEHLEVMTKQPIDLLPYVRHAGAIFLGRYSSEPVGDYFAGPNHVLPTSGTARFLSPLTVNDFVKKSSVISYSEAALKQHGKKIAQFARLEGLEAHARAIEIRFESRIKKV
ncbi:histidinol dehydrogenase [Bacillus carboniphilus]|uniref:Histidinol dehydrogenase n=1 Tax=Bacillus carboniphilus TaxID=86663 RepID=A0ABY9JPY1_9BACI|nr:histidinol dehydrogenase [Bacillus carboniphilus]WLR41441.1 histidinol dehydrogenase [Bacillus carboniphilus]